MKKLLFMMALLISAVTMNAQTALQESKLLDQVSIGGTAGVTTPLTFNSTFPLNTFVGITLQKDLTPVFALQAEGLMFLNANNGWAISDAKTLVKGTNVGINGKINLSNAIAGFQGTPRAFEVSAVAGLGWLHEWETKANFLTSKTGVDLAINLGQKKAHSIVVTPAILWNLNKTGKLQFNKQFAQLMIGVNYVYHFKTSNGTHSFKKIDVGAMQQEITRLNEELAKKPTTLEVIKEVPVQVTPAVTKSATDGNPWVVQFAQNKADLDDEAKTLLDKIPSGITVNIIGTASPEGAEALNQTLSLKRATAVADLLKAKGVTVANIIGGGVKQGETTNRLAIIEVVPQ